MAFSCKRRGICPSCGARRMAQTAAHLVDHVIPRVPVRQWVLSFPIPLRILLAADPQLLSEVLQIVHRVIATFRIKHSGLKASPDQANLRRLAALVRRPRLHLIRFHGVLAPNAKLRAAIVPEPARRI